MLTLYGQSDSGNCYKPRLLLAKLGIQFRHIEVSSLGGATRTPEFLAKNPNGKVPLLEFEGGKLLSESNAMLLYLSEGTPYLPTGAFERALVYQWLFFEQYSHEPYVAVRRALMVYPERGKDATPERLAATLAGGEKALQVMETQLAKTDFLTGEALTVADIALYAYTHQAEQGGFDLAKYPAVLAWLSRVSKDEGHVSIEWLP